MYKYFLGLFLILLCVACTNDSNEQTSSQLLSESTLLYGCNEQIIDGIQVANIEEEKQDIVEYSIDGDKLIIHLGFNAPCCIIYEADAEINGDKLEFNVVNIGSEDCDCICFYDFDFQFTSPAPGTYTYKYHFSDELHGELVVVI